MRSFSETRNGTIVQAGRVGSPSGTALSISADAYEQAQQQLPINRRNQPSRLQGVRQIDARALKSIKRHLPTFNNFVDETPFPKDNIRNSPNKPDTSHSASPYLISYKGTKGTIVIDLDKEDELEKKVAETDLMQDEDYEDLFLPSTDIKLGDHLPGMKGVSPAACRRNGTPETSFDILERFSSDNRTLKAGKTVEMTDGDFLRIRSVLRDRTSTEVILRGHRLRRVKHLNGVLELKMNELAMVLEVEDSDPRDAIVQGVEQVPLSQIGRARELIITNRPYPDLSFRVLEQTYLSQEYIFDNCRLVCRWKYILSFRTARERVLNKNCEKSLVRFHTSELGKESSVSEDVLRRNWRGDTIKGGSCLKTSPEEEEFDAQERQMSRGSDLLSFNQRIQTVGSATRSLKSPSKKRSNSSGSSTNWPEMIPTSSINGSSTSPVVLDEDKSIVFTSPTIQIRRSSPKTYDRNQKMKHQIMIDITGDECPRISLKNLSISERQSGPASHDQTQSKGLHGPPSRRASRSLQGSDAIMSPKHTLPLDVVEISAQITTKSKRGIFRAEYAGVLPCLDHCSTPAKRLKKSNTTVVDAAFTDAYCYPSTQADMLWSSPPVPISPPQLGAPASSITSESTMSPETMLRDADRTRILPTRKLLTNSSSESSTRHTSTRKTSKPTLSQQKQRYTFGDAFCGAGGTSRGAKSAGFHVDWGFDFDPAAITSYQLNFYEAKCLAAWAHDFVQISEGDESKVDVLHLSPPCQVFSFAHTVDGKDDEMNTATFFAVVELVKRARPRVVTLENTSGLAVLYPLWLNTAINFFTSLGFSIRWKILNFAEYGLAQARKRLIIIASWLVVPILEALSFS